MALDHIKALAVRGFFCLHFVLVVWRVTVAWNEQYWYLAAAIAPFVIEGAYTTIKRRGIEWKLFSFSFFFYLAATLPGIWLLEIKKTETYQSQNQSQVEDLKISGLEIPVRLSPDTWVLVVEELMLYLMIFGRWFLPRGDVGREQLTQLLFAFIGIASDIMELFSLFDEASEIRHNTTLTYIILGVWSLSVLQFTLTFATANRPRKGRGLRLSPTEMHDEDQKHRRSVLRVELLATVLSLFMQDGPFVCVRLFAMITYKVITYSLVFFTAKNVLVILLLFYKIVLLLGKLCCPNSHLLDDDEDGEGYKEEFGDQTKLSLGFFDYKSGGDGRTFERTISLPKSHQNNSRVADVEAGELRKRKDDGSMRPLSMEANAYSVDIQREPEVARNSSEGAISKSGRESKQGEILQQEESQGKDRDRSSGGGKSPVSTSGYGSGSNRVSTSESDEDRREGHRKSTTSNKEKEGRKGAKEKDHERQRENDKSSKRASKISNKEAKPAEQKPKSESSGVQETQTALQNSTEPSETLPDQGTLPDLHTIIEGPATPAKPMEKSKKFDKMMADTLKKSKKEKADKSSDQEGEDEGKEGSGDVAEESAKGEEQSSVPESQLNSAWETDTHHPLDAHAATNFPRDAYSTRDFIQDAYAAENVPVDAYGAADFPGEEEVRKVTELLDGISSDSDGDSDELPPYPSPDYPEQAQATTGMASTLPYPPQANERFQPESSSSNLPHTVPKSSDAGYPYAVELDGKRARYIANGAPNTDPYANASAGSDYGKRPDISSKGFGAASPNGSIERGKFVSVIKVKK